MTGKDLDNLKDLFSEYVHSFYLPEPKEQLNITLKEEHTSAVCKTIRLLAKKLSLGSDKVLLAETIGLFHDIGRFPQYARYKTFRDSISVNHGKLGADILVEEGFLSEIGPEERRAVISAVRFHNAFIAPRLEYAEDLFFLRLIRDADKLDIWRIFLDFFEADENNRPMGAVLGLPDTPGYSAGVLSSLKDNKVVSHGLLKNLNDFKLLQISWVFDLNFRPSFELVRKNQYIEKFFALLPQTRDVLKASSLIKDFVRRKAKAEGQSSLGGKT